MRFVFATRSLGKKLTTCVLFGLCLALPAYAVNPPSFYTLFEKEENRPDGGVLPYFPHKIQLGYNSGLGDVAYYTVDHSDPITSPTRQLYSAPFLINGTTEIKAVAYNAGSNQYSTVVTNWYAIDYNARPLRLLDLIVWLRSDPDAILTNVGNPPPVNTWIDFSGKTLGAYHATQANAANKPTLLSSGLNQLPAVKFDPSVNGQFLQFPANGFSSPVSFIAVVKLNAPPAANARLVDVGRGNGDSNFYLSQPNSTNLEMHSYNFLVDNSMTATNAVKEGGYQLLTAVYNQSAQSGRILVNGSQIATSNAMGLGGQNGVRNLNFLGQASGGGNYLNGEVSELMWYRNVITDNDLRFIHAYLGNKFEIPLVTSWSPTFFPSSTSFNAPTQVAINVPNGAQVLYSLDGSTPTPTSGIPYNGPILINQNGQTLKAIAVLNGAVSSVTSATYTLPSIYQAPNPGDVTAPVIELQLPRPTQ